MRPYSGAALAERGNAIRDNFYRGGWYGGRGWYADHFNAWWPGRWWGGFGWCGSGSIGLFTREVTLKRSRFATCEFYRKRLRICVHGTLQKEGSIHIPAHEMKTYESEAHKLA